MSSFSGMNYRDLQKLAKTAGVKANLPKAELIKALQDNAANDSVEMEDSPTSTKSSRKSQDVLNSTFEVEETKLNSTFEKDGVDTKLNSTFEKENIPGEKRKSSRLSVDGLAKRSVGVEMKNSPKPRKSLNTNTDVSLSVPARKPTPRASGVKKQTPRLSGVKKQTPRLSGVKKQTPRLSGVQKQTPRLSGVQKQTPRLSGVAKKAPRLSGAQTPRTSGGKKQTPRTLGGRIVKPLRPGQKPISTPGSTLKVSKVSTPKTASKLAVKKAEPSAIPRFVKFAKKVPNFAKMHEDQFSKMESLDTYLDKKKKRTEATQEQFKKARTLAEEHTKIVERMKARTPAAAKFVPKVISMSKINLNFGSAETPASGRKQAFKFTAAPAVISAKKPERVQKDVKAMTRDKPKARNHALKAPETPRDVPETPKPLNNITNKSVAETPGSVKKQFNLKASLAKPLGYKPHTGKLPTWGDKKKVIEPSAVSAKEMMDRTRNIIKGVRMNKRAALLLQKRNIQE